MNEVSCYEPKLARERSEWARYIERDGLGIQGILAELNCCRQIPHEQFVRSLRLLCHEVLPHFTPRRG
jgi:hypothetical protein